MSFLRGLVHFGVSLSDVFRSRPRLVKFRAKFCATMNLQLFIFNFCWRFGCIAALCGVALAVCWGRTQYAVHRLHEASMYLTFGIKGGFANPSSGDLHGMWTDKTTESKPEQKGQVTERKTATKRKSHRKETRKRKRNKKEKQQNRKATERTSR